MKPLGSRAFCEKYCWCKVADLAVPTSESLKSLKFVAIQNRMSKTSKSGGLKINFINWVMADRLLHSDLGYQFSTTLFINKFKIVHYY